MKKASIIAIQLFCLVVFLSFTANAQSNCIYTVNLTRLLVPAAGGNYSVNITTQPGCAWTAYQSTASTRPPGITFTSATSGTGSGSVNFTVVENISSSTRQGGVDIRDGEGVRVGSFSIEQDRICTVPFFLPQNINIPIEGTTPATFNGAFPNSANCFTSVRSNDSWITIISHNLNGVVTFSVSANNGSARTGTISIITNTSLNIDQTVANVTVSQAGQQTCTYSLSPTSVQTGAAGAVDGFNITTQTGCNWTAQSNASWITVSNASGSGAGKINYSVQPNTGEARSGTITAGGQMFSIYQVAPAPLVELIRASGRVIDANFKSIRGAIVSFTNVATGETRTTITNQFGYFHFANIERGQPYSIAITHKRYKFTTKTVTYNTGALIPIYNPDPEQ